MKSIVFIGMCLAFAFQALAGSSYINGRSVDALIIEGELDALDIRVTGVETGKADLVHSHDIDDVTNLQAELDGKASTGDVAQVASDLAAHETDADVHDIAAIEGLQDELDGKADTNHVGQLDFTGADVRIADGTETNQPVTRAQLDAVSPTPDFTQFTNVYYVSKSGDDSNTGRNPEESLLTLTEALGRVEPGDAVVAIGGGVYEEDIILSRNTWLYAPSAVLRGSLSIGSCSIVDLNWHLAADHNTVLVRNIGCTDRSVYRTRLITGRSGTAAYTNTTLFRNEVDSGILKVEANVAYVSVGGAFISPDFVGGSGDLINFALDPDSFSGNTGETSIFNNVRNLAVGEPATRVAEWHCDTTADSWTNHWVQYDIGENKEVTHYELMMRFSARAPQAWRMYGSTNESDWVLLDTVTGRTSGTWMNDVFHRFEADASGDYQYYRIIWDESNQSGETGRLRINAMTLLGNGGGEFVGGKMTFDIDEVRLAAGSVGIKAADGDCDYQGFIKRVQSETGVTDATGFDVQAGNVFVRGNSANVGGTLYNVGGTGSLYFDYQDYSGTETGDAVKPADFMADGSVPMTGNFNAGGNALTNLDPATYTTPGARPFWVSDDAGRLWPTEHEMEVASRTINVATNDGGAGVQAALDSLGTYLPAGVTITVQPDAGNYVFTNTLTIPSFDGGGKFVITSGCTTNIAYTNQPVTFDFSGVNANAIVCFDANSVVEFTNIKVIGYGGETQRNVFNLDRCKNFRLRFCNIVASGDANTSAVATWSGGSSRRNYISGHTRGLHVGLGGRLHSFGDVSDPPNEEGYRADGILQVGQEGGQSLGATNTPTLGGLIIFGGAILP